MHSAANSNLVLKGLSSLQRFADSRTGISYREFYQRLASELVDRTRRKQILADIGERLVVLAERAHAFREMDALDQVGQVLIELPLPGRYQTIGQYYQGLCIQRFGTGDVHQAETLLGRVCERAPDAYRTRGMISLGTNYKHRSDNESALLLYREAARLALKRNIIDAYAAISTQKMVAVISGEDGNHRDAAALLENLFPVAHTARRSHPHVYYDYLNSLAVELCEVGRIEEASNISQVVLASPFARAYPEWRETSKEIALRGYRPSRATVAFGRGINEAEDQGHIRRERVAGDLAAGQPASETKNVVCLRMPESGHDAAESAALTEPARVLNMQEWKNSRPKQSTGDSRAKTPKPKTSKERQDRIAQLMQMETRKLMLALIEAVCEEDIDDDVIIRALIVLEGLDEPDENPGA